MREKGPERPHNGHRGWEAALSGGEGVHRSHALERGSEIP